MGCDIHAYREKQVNGEWLPADEWEPSKYEDEAGRLRVDWDKQADIGRNYDLFGLLAKGVRREFDQSFLPRGLPVDVTAPVKAEADSCSGDAHNHSYLYLHEVKDFAKFLETQVVRIEGFKDRDELAALQASILSGTPDWSLLYPFNQGTNNPRHVPFEIDVPASFKVGKGLQDIIDSFDGIEGQNHRLVFWFDN